MRLFRIFRANRKCFVILTTLQLCLYYNFNRKFFCTKSFKEPRVFEDIFSEGKNLLIRIKLFTQLGGINKRAGQRATIIYYEKFTFPIPAPAHVTNKLLVLISCGWIFHEEIINDTLWYVSQLSNIFCNTSGVVESVNLNERKSFVNYSNATFSFWIWTKWRKININLWPFHFNTSNLYR